MTKLLAIAAMALCFTTNANANSLPEPVQALVATVEYTASVPVKVTQAAWNRINENSRNANLVRLVTEDTSQCIGAASHLGEIPACTLDMGGSFVTAIWSTAGFFIADAAEIGVKTVSGVLSSWARAFDACYQATQGTIGLPVGLACKVISFALDMTGMILSKVVGLTLEVVRAIVGGVSTVLQNVFALPAALLRGNIQAAFQALFNVVRTVVLCVVPLAPIVLALLGRNDELRAMCGGK